jgi:hypothetical protein
LTEKRKVDSSILSLTTITDLAKWRLTCGNVVRRRSSFSNRLRLFTAGDGWLCPIRAQVSRCIVTAGSGIVPGFTCGPRLGA